jgi:hypothetical protein
MMAFMSVELLLGSTIEKSVRQNTLIGWRESVGGEMCFIYAQ